MLRFATIFSLVLCGTWFVFDLFGWDVPTFISIAGHGANLSTVTGICLGFLFARDS